MRFAIQRVPGSPAALVEAKAFLSEARGDLERLRARRKDAARDLREAKAYLEVARAMLAALKMDAARAEHH